MRVNSGIAPPHPHPHPHPSASAQPELRGSRQRSNESGTWFEASGAFGNVRLCAAPGAQTARHAADAAIMLRSVEPLLAALDDWTGAELAWRWVDAAPQGMQCALARAHWRGDSQEPDCFVFWPWALLRSLPAPPPRLAAQLDWPMVAATLVLGTLVSLRRLQSSTTRWTS